jgi:hypothetical protein
MSEKKSENISKEELSDALCNAITSPSVDINRIHQLIAAGACPHRYVMFSAIMTGRLDLVEILVEAGADMDSMDNDFDVPLQYAKEALLFIESGEEGVWPKDGEYDKIAAYLEELSSQETKNIVEERRKDLISVPKYPLMLLLDLPIISENPRMVRSILMTFQ